MAHPLHKLAAHHVQALEDLGLGHAPVVVARGPFLAPKLVNELPMVPLMARREEDHPAHDRLHERLRELFRSAVTQREQQVRVQRAHAARTLVHLVILLVGILTNQLVIPAEQNGAQLAPQELVELRAEFVEVRAHARPKLDPAEWLAPDRVVLATLVVEYKGDEVVHA